MKSHVTTRVGDRGTTRTLGGDVVSKSDPILACTGELDTLRAQLALLRLEVLRSGHPERERLGEFLIWLLHTCFLVGAEVNDPRRVHPEYRPDEIGPKHLDRLEAEQRRMEEVIDLPKAFIASAATIPAAYADLTATTARAFERALVRLTQDVPEFRADHLLPFANRLSDFLYILARHLEEGRHHPVDYGVLESP